MLSLTLLRQQSKLADPREQLKILAAQDQVPTFDAQLESHQLPLLQAQTLETLQVNLGRLCNMTCEHCHVDAGPDRREIMQIENIEHCLRALAHPGFQTLDLTGGAPEMNPHFRLMVRRGREMGKRIIEWVADEEGGDWFFHCHLLYHMHSGMFQVVTVRPLGGGQG